jgi:hypothetical protein
MAINTTFNARLTSTNMPNLNNKNEQKTEDFKTEIKLAQLPSAASMTPIYARPMNPSFAPVDASNLYPSTPKSNIYKTRSIVPEATIQNDQQMYDLMAKHPNPLKAPKDFILYLSKWLNPAAQTRAPAVYALASDYIDKYVLMAEGGKPKKGLSRGEKANHNRDGSKRPDNRKPPKKPDPKTPTPLKRDQSGFPDNTADKTPSNQTQASVKQTATNSNITLTKKYGKSNHTHSLPNRFNDKIQAWALRNNINWNLIRLGGANRGVASIKGNPFKPTDATKMSDSEMLVQKDGFMRYRDGSLWFKKGVIFINATEIDFIKLP